MESNYVDVIPNHDFIVIQIIFHHFSCSDNSILGHKGAAVKPEGKASVSVDLEPSSRISEEKSQDISIFFEVDNGMRIKNPLSAHEPPTAFVSMKPCFQYKESNVD